MSDVTLNLEAGLRFAGAAAVVTWNRLRRGPQRARWRWRDEWMAVGMRRHFADIEGRPWPEQRRTFTLMAPRPESLRGVRVERATLAERPALWITPDGPAPAKTLLYLHGGAYLFGGPDDYAELVANIARAASVRAVVPDYRLAPEHPFPAALEDALAFYRALLRSGVSPKELVVAGDSAGGGLTASLLVALRDAGEPLPSRAALICPWVDMTAKGASMDANTGVDVFTPSMIDAWAKQVLHGASADDPRASPIYADLRGLPPLLVQVGGAEMLLDQDTRFAEMARRAGTEVTLRVWDDCIHDWHVYARVIDEGRRAIEELAAFLRDGHTERA